MGLLRSPALLCLTAATLATSVLLAARPVATVQVRDSQPPQQGTGVIAGTVVAADTGAPLREARLSLSVDGEHFGPRVVVTDDRGIFAFSGVPAGRYRLSAQKTGFVPTGYGQKRPGVGRWTPIELTEGQRIERLTFTLARTAVVTGVVFDDFGEPAMGARVMASRYVTVSGNRHLIGAGLAEVDDRGAYRLHSLMPGEYVIAVTSGSGPTMSEAYQAGAATRLAAIASGAGNPPLTVRFGPGPSPAEPPAMAYVPTFYPGAVNLSAATPIVLAAGEVRPGIDIRLQRMPIARVAGVVRDLDGTVPQGDVRFLEIGGLALSDDGNAPRKTATLDGDGRFAWSDVAPGQYVLMVRKRVAAGSPSSDFRWATQELTVSGAPVDLALTLQPPLAVSGSIGSDSGGLPDVLPNVVMFTPIGTTRFLADPLGQQFAPIGANGFFAAENLVPGRYAVSVFPELAGWRLVSAMFGGRDALDFMLEVKAGEAVRGSLTLSRRETELSGTLTNTAGQPTRCCTVVVFAADERYWVPGNRRNLAVDPDANGRYVFRDLPAGAYRLAALEDYDPVAGVDRALMRQAAPASVLVTLATGESKVQHLRTR